MKYTQWVRRQLRLAMNGLAQSTMYGAIQSEKSIRRVSYREELEQNAKYHQEQLNKAQELLKLLDENPIILRFMELTR